MPFATPDEAGRYPIVVLDRSKSKQQTVARINMYVDLPHQFKGTHMSRFIEVLNAHGSVVHVENIPDILYAMQGKLNAATSHLEMEFPFFLEKRAPVSGMTGLMDYTARFDASAFPTRIAAEADATDGAASPDPQPAASTPRMRVATT